MGPSRCSSPRALSTASRRHTAARSSPSRLRAMGELVRLILALSGGFVVGACIVGGIVWAHLGLERNFWRELWKAEARLRADERHARAGALDRLPSAFRVPPLRSPRKPRVSPALFRRWLRTLGLSRRT